MGTRHNLVKTQELRGKQCSITTLVEVAYIIFSLPATESTLPLVLSGFSHIEPWHLSLNMLALWSFAPAFLCKYMIRLKALV